MRRLISRAVAVGCLLGANLLLSSCGGSKLSRQGRELYAYYCAHCHGTKGQGNGFNAVNIDPRPRDHTDSSEPYMAGRTNEEIFEAVSKGGRGVGKSPFMPPFGGVLSEEEIWSLVAYMRTLHPNKAPEVVVPADATKERPKFPVIPIRKVNLEIPREEGEEDTDPEEARIRLARIGKRLFEEKYGCISCHGVDGVGGTVGPSLSRVGFRLRPEYIYSWIKNPQSIKPDTKMPNFMLSDRDALAITVFLSTLKGSPEGPPEARGRP